MSKWLLAVGVLDLWYNQELANWTRIVSYERRNVFLRTARMMDQQPGPSNQSEPSSLAGLEPPPARNTSAASESIGSTHTIQTIYVPDPPRPEPERPPPPPRSLLSRIVHAPIDAFTSAWNAFRVCTTSRAAALEQVRSALRSNAIGQDQGAAPNPPIPRQPDN